MSDQFQQRFPGHGRVVDHGVGDPVRARETSSSPRVTRFGLFEVDLQVGELRKCGLRIKLQEKPFQILARLLEQPGAMVTRQELRQRLWPADTFVDFERSLNTGIRKLRAALGDDPDNPRFVETLLRRGYRFIAPIEGIRPAEKIMLAVLPLENLSDDPAQEYFSDGLTEELITQLARLCPRRIGVIARSSIMRYRGTEKGVDQIGRELSVDYILEGSVRRAGDRVRVAAQLIQVSDQVHLWAESYDRELADIFAIQSQIAQQVAHSLELELLPTQQAALAQTQTTNFSAYESYLKGRHYWNQFTEDGSRKGIAHFGQAIESDPRYAPAYAGLALCYAQLGGLFGGIPATEAFPKAKEAALKALEIDEMLDEAHGALGVSSLFHEWDWTAAERQFQRALALNPGSGFAHHRYALYLAAMGSLNNACAEEKKALELDPLSLLFNTVLAWLLYFVRQYDQAVEQCEKTLDLDFNYALAHRQMGRARERQLMFEEAIAAFERAESLSRHMPMCVAALGHTFAVAGRESEAHRVLEELQELSKRRHVSSYFHALIYLGLGEKDRGFEYLYKASEERSLWLIFLNAEPVFDLLRSDPQFHDLLHRVGLPARRNDVAASQRTHATRQ